MTIERPETATALPVTVVSVCYNSTGVLPAMLSSVPSGLPIVLVDNGSRDLDLLRDLAAEAGAQLIELGQNIGFGRACNRGAEGARTEFLLFLNPDAGLEPGAFEALVAGAGAHPRAVAMNPAIREADGSEYFKRGSVLLSRDRWLPRGWPAATRVVPVLSGAALFVRRADFEAVGGFDPAIFLYHEDDDLALRLAQRGDLLFLREAVARHSGGRSSARSPEIAALKAWHMGRSRVYAARKHGLPRPFATAFWQAVRQLASPVALFSVRKRAKQMAFLRGVWSMRDGGGR